MEEWFQCESLRTEFIAFVFQFLRTWVLYVKNFHSDSFDFFSYKKWSRDFYLFLEQQILQQQRCLLSKIATVPTQSIIFKVSFQPQPCLPENTGWWKSPSSLLKCAELPSPFLCYVYGEISPGGLTGKCIS